MPTAPSTPIAPATRETDLDAACVEVAAAHGVCEFSDADEDGHLSYSAHRDEARGADEGDVDRAVARWHEKLRRAE